MSKIFFILAVVLGLTIVGCSKGEMLDSNPPSVYLQIDQEKYLTKLGTYCWKNKCADVKAPPTERLKGKEPIVVTPGEVISLLMDYEPKPNEVYFAQYIDVERKEVQLKDNRFNAPIHKGVYYYSYRVAWMDEEDKHLSHGDASYDFVIEVK
ncbi:hypothetical protein ACFSCX_19440 [Bacillus salitolerans]|uniref:Lipoprotein n=1 Tax=Bacillus salitolerans TaxID=1437434 RepID=A0ABW4LU96_9BACI